MEEQINLDEMTITGLKALDWEEIRKIEISQNNRKVINQKIKEKIEEREQQAVAAKVNKKEK